MNQGWIRQGGGDDRLDPDGIKHCRGESGEAPEGVADQHSGLLNHLANERKTLKSPKPVVQGATGIPAGLIRGPKADQIEGVDAKS